jgi:hypothetical protein
MIALTYIVSIDRTVDYQELYVFQLAVQRLQSVSSWFYFAPISQYLIMFLKFYSSDLRNALKSWDLCTLPILAHQMHLLTDLLLMT